jgi:hypothetical protein
MLALGDAHCLTGRAPRNAAVPFQLLLGAVDPLTRRSLDRLDPTALAATSDRVTELLGGLGSNGAEPHEALIRDELAWAGEAVRIGCDLGRLRLEHAAIDHAASLPATQRRALIARLDQLIDARRALWLRRSRPGGLADALGHLRRARAALGD